jgi:hypothetical protein
LAKLKRVGVFSSGKVMGFAGLLVGVVPAVFYGGLLLLGTAAGPPKNQSAFLGLGSLFIILLPLIYAAMSFVGGVIHAIALNIVLGLSGGLELELGE